MYAIRYGTDATMHPMPSLMRAVRAARDVTLPRRRGPGWERAILPNDPPLTTREELLPPLHDSAEVLRLSDHAIVHVACAAPAPPPPDDATLEAWSEWGRQSGRRLMPAVHAEIRRRNVNRETGAFIVGGQHAHIMTRWDDRQWTIGVVQAGPPPVVMIR